jgi:S-adenosyl methyltransferase
VRPGCQEVAGIREDAPAGLDTTTPNVARIYDYLLGGKDNFAADRAAAKQLLTVIPDVAAIAADNRAFLGRAVRYLASQGVRQFLDLGSGLPTRSNVHEVARENAPGTRVVYADYDPVVALHGKALLAPGRDVAVLHADLAEPSSILEHPDLLRVLDLSRPVGVICASALHFVPDEADPWGVIAQYRDRLCSGSYLAITHAPARVPGEDPEHDEENAAEVFRQTSAPLHMRTLAEITRFFDGFELVAPGVVFMQDWRPDPGTHAAGRLRSFRAGVGRKP